MADDIHLMCGQRPNFFFLLCWRYITPSLMVVLFVGSVASVIHEGGETYFKWDGQKGESIRHRLPLWAQFFCGIVACLSTISIPAVVLATKFGCCKIEFNFTEEEFVSDYILRKLRQKHKVDQYQPSRLEKYLLCIKKTTDEESEFNYPPARHVSQVGSHGNHGQGHGYDDRYGSMNELTVGTIGE